MSAQKTKISIQPLGDRIVVSPVKEAEKTKSGIILPDTVNKEKPAQGRVMAIGDGERIKKFGVKKGDIVIFKEYGGTEFKIDGAEYKVLSLSSDPKDDEILAVLK